MSLTIIGNLGRIMIKTKRRRPIMKVILAIAAALTAAAVGFGLVWFYSYRKKKEEFYNC
jgi:hypothetical protein